MVAPKHFASVIYLMLVSFIVAWLIGAIRLFALQIIYLIISLFFIDSFLSHYILFFLPKKLRCFAWQV